MLLTCSYPHIFFIHFFICHGQLLILYEWRILDQLYLLGLHITYYEKMKFQTLVSVTSLIFWLEFPLPPPLSSTTLLSLSLSLSHTYTHTTSLSLPRSTNIPKNVHSAPHSSTLVVVDLGFTTLLKSQVISVAYYSEREKFDKFFSGALISA